MHITVPILTSKRWSDSNISSQGKRNNVANSMEIFKTLFEQRGRDMAKQVLSLLHDCNRKTMSNPPTKGAVHLMHVDTSVVKLIDTQTNQESKNHNKSSLRISSCWIDRISWFLLVAWTYPKNIQNYGQQLTHNLKWWPPARLLQSSVQWRTDIYFCAIPMPGGYTVSTEGPRLENVHTIGVVAKK